MNILKIYFLLILTLFFSTAFANDVEFTRSAKSSNKILYNITASDTHRFVWFRVAKVATRTIRDIFEKNVPLSVNSFSVSYKRKDYEGYFKFAFVRNPWDRVVSCYCNKVIPKNHRAFEECFGKDFNYFIDFINRQDLITADPHIRLQSSLFPIKEMDFIGKLENFPEDLSYVLSILKLDHFPIGHKNKTNHKHYSQYYSEHTKKIIAKKYKVDIQNFGYEFEYK